MLFAKYSRRRPLRAFRAHVARGRRDKESLRGTRPIWVMVWLAQPGAVLVEQHRVLGVEAKPDHFARREA